eukprot:6441402-Amphidinium_carterae.1
MPTVAPPRLAVELSSEPFFCFFVEPPSPWLSVELSSESLCFFVEPPPKLSVSFVELSSEPLM